MVRDGEGDPLDVVVHGVEGAKIFVVGRQPLLSADVGFDK